MFDKQIDAHLRSLEPAPKRQSEKHNMTGKYCGTCHRWSQHGYGFIQPDTPIAEIAGEVFVGFRGLRRSGINHPLQRGGANGSRSSVARHKTTLRCLIAARP
jgi:cold shock CspA family protein